MPAPHWPALAGCAHQLDSGCWRADEARIDRPSAGVIGLRREQQREQHAADVVACPHPLPYP